MSKKLTQQQIDKMADHVIEQLVLDVAVTVNFDLNTRGSIEGQINRIMRMHGLTDGLMLRRSFDGVTEANWMVRKMIGEFLAEGKAKI